VIAELQCVVLDCPDPVELAELYRSLLGGTVNQPDRRWSLDDGSATLHTPSGLLLASGGASILPGPARRTDRLIGPRRTSSPSEPEGEGSQVLDVEGTF
jgi:hypothetical protein